MRIDDAALEILREQKEKRVWYGDPQLCHDIYTRSGLKKAYHPINVISAVVAALGRSPKWRRVGYINHLRHDYPVYEPAPHPGSDERATGETK